ncbi:MAG: dihydrofolate reductase family protein [Saprospiraceae bacterium]
MKNHVFIATSMDGYIADRDGRLDWLDQIPNPNHDDMGYFEFYNRMDALVMGRFTFETVLGFDVDWPYDKPVFVLSNQLSQIPDSHREKAFLVKGTLSECLSRIQQKGYVHLYIDGGQTITNFLEEDLIDEVIITTIPIVLGAGIPLFGKLSRASKWKLVQSRVFLNQMVQNHYIRE